MHGAKGEKGGCGLQIGQSHLHKHPKWSRFFGTLFRSRGSTFLSSRSGLGKNLEKKRRLSTF